MTRLSTTFVTLFYVFGTAGIAACSGTTQQLGGNPGQTGETRAALGEACSCLPGGDCCAEGLICDECEGSAGTGLSCKTNDNRCRRPRGQGTLCDLTEQCAPGMTCMSASDSALPTCVRAGSQEALPPGRCRESLDCGSNEVCVESHCKLATGAYCTMSNQCASNVCYVAEGCR